MLFQPINNKRTVDVNKKTWIQDTPRSNQTFCIGGARAP